MQVDNGTASLDQVGWNYQPRSANFDHEVAFVRAVETNLFANGRPLNGPTSELCAHLAKELELLAASSLAEAKQGAMAAYDDPSADSVSAVTIKEFCDLLKKNGKGDGDPGPVSNAGNLLRMVGVAYEVATALIQKKYKLLTNMDLSILGAIETSIDAGENTISQKTESSVHKFLSNPVYAALADSEKKILLRIVRFGQLQDAYRNGFELKMVDLEGGADSWWDLAAFNKEINRRRVERSEELRVLRYFKDSLQILFYDTEKLNFKGRYRWCLMPDSVLFWVSRFFGLSESGDISGTTADALFVLETVLAMPEAQEVRKQWGENLPMVYTIPLLQMVNECHHTILEIGYVLTLNDVCENYVIGDYSTLLPKGIDPKGAIGQVFFNVAKQNCPAWKLYFDGDNQAEIKALIEDKYKPDNNTKSLGDLTCAIGENAKIWTMQTEEEKAAYRRIATVGRMQYKMFSCLRNEMNLSKSAVLAQAFAHGRADALNRLDLVRVEG